MCVCHKKNINICVSYIQECWSLWDMVWPIEGYIVFKSSEVATPSVIPHLKIMKGIFSGTSPEHLLYSISTYRKKKEKRNAYATIKNQPSNECPSTFASKPVFPAPGTKT